MVITGVYGRDPEKLSNSEMAEAITLNTSLAKNKRCWKWGESVM